MYNFILYLYIMEIVVALYKEDVSWIRNLCDKYSITVYNKSDTYPHCIDDLIKKNKINYITLKNLGKESHTYFYHILKNYDNLPNKIFFTQANPFDHIIKKQIASNEFFYGLIEDFDKNQSQFKGYGAKHYLWITGIGESKIKACKKLYTTLFTNKFEDWTFRNAGIFGVTKEEILMRSKEFYLRCFESLNKEWNPPEGYAFERLWSCIFDKKYNSKIK